MDFKLTVLGTASALPTVNRYPSAQVLEIRGRLFLLDCGEGTQMQMRRYSISMMKVEKIFISHIHGDHLFGIFGLLSTMAMSGRTAPLEIYAPAQFATILSFFKANFVEKMNFETVHFPLNHIKSPTIISETRNVEIYAFPLNHRIAAYGFMFREKTPQLNIRKDAIERYSLSLQEIGRLKKGENIYREDGSLLDCSELTYMPYVPRSYAYCSDTAPFETLPSWIKGVDLLYHEATFDDSLREMAEATYHSTARQAAECALKAGVSNLLLGHYSSRFRFLDNLLEEAKSVFADTLLAYEGMVFDIPLKKSTCNENI